MATTSDVTIIGGGIIGLTSAYLLAKSGCRVTVLDRGLLGKEASWAGAGIIPPGNPQRATNTFERLRAHSVSQFPAFTRELKELTGIDNGYFTCGGIEFLPADDLETLQAWQHEGIEFQLRDSAQLRALEPNLTPIPGQHAFELAGCAQVRNPRHLRALEAGCEQYHVQFRPNNRGVAWIRERDRIVGIRTETGAEFHSNWFVVASGAWSEPLLSDLGCQLDVIPIRGQIVLYRPLQPILKRVIMVGKRYLVPRADGRILVGSTEEPDAGFEKRTTTEGVEELKQFAFGLLPALENAEVEASWAGLRPGTRDELPCLGPLARHPNVIVATGHFRSGVQLSLGTALFIQHFIAGTAIPFPITELSPDRSIGTAAKRTFRS